jgi:hypothetical protein
MITNDLYVIEIHDLWYDRNILLEIFNQAKDHARVKGLKWRDKPVIPTPANEALSVVIQYGDYMMVDPKRNGLSYNLLEHEYIKKLVDKLNFEHPITPRNVDIIWYRPGFEFEPHTDHYAASTMMWPIFPEDGGQPIDFYYKENLEIKKGEANEFKNIVTDDDIIYTHHYSTTHPTIFNSHWIHGVRLVDRERAFLRLRLNENFESIVNKYRNKTLIKNDN